MTTRERVFASIAVLLGIVASLAALEVVLRVLPVRSGFRMAPVSAQAPVAHLEPNEPYTFSTGWNLENVNRGRINNAGFINDQDYRRQDAKPLLAVVGDSFIEARMVAYPDTLQGRLAKALEKDFRVYSFAAGGAPLSQYLIWARSAVRDYGAAAVIINVVLNDFDESYVAYRMSPAYWIYVDGADEQLRLQLFEYRRSTLRSILSKSALVRYLVNNLKLEHFVQTLPLWRTASARPAAAARAEDRGDVPDDADARRMRMSDAVIEAFFRDVPAMIGLPPERILFTVDGYHYPQSAAANAGRYFDRMRRTFLAKAEALGYGAIDLDPYFFAHYRKHGKSFEVPDDGHWNAVGHEVAAEAVLSGDFAQRLRRQP
jgi:hypothetical protein